MAKLTKAQQEAVDALGLTPVQLENLDMLAAFMDAGQGNYAGQDADPENCPGVDVWTSWQRQRKLIPVGSLSRGLAKAGSTCKEHPSSVSIKDRDEEQNPGRLTVNDLVFCEQDSDDSRGAWLTIPLWPTESKEVRDQVYEAIMEETEGGAPVVKLDDAATYINIVGSDNAKKTFQHVLDTRVNVAQKAGPATQAAAPRRHKQTETLLIIAPSSSMDERYGFYSNPPRQQAGSTSEQTEVETV